LLRRFVAESLGESSKIIETLFAKMQRFELLGDY
tara:strand:- start:6983 stop:7084 length:102 start_codon:yes stop_codon:yes gene_type:complete